MNDIKLLELALSKGEYYTVAYIMVNLYADYVEGDIQASLDKYRKHFPDMPEEVIINMIEMTPFDGHKAFLGERLELLMDKK